MTKYFEFLLVCFFVPTIAALAQTNNPATPSPASNSISYSIYGQVLFMQPNGSDLYYAAQAIPANPNYTGTAQVASPDWTIYEISPDYAPGFKVGTKFIFNESMTNIDLNWERLHTSDIASHPAATFVGVSKQPMVGPITDIGPNSAAYTFAQGNFTSHFDGVNLNFGKTIILSKRLTTDLYAGAGFARIKQTAINTYTAGSTTSRIINTYSTFIGAGPQFRGDFDFRIAGEFYFDGSFICSLIVGQIKNGTTYTSNTPDLEEAPIFFPTSTNIQTTTVPNRVQLVPELEQSLGFSYLVGWKRCKLDLSIGYRCQVYFNAIQTMDMLTQAVPEDFTDIAPSIAVFALTYNRTLSNYILIGPYAGVDISF